MAYELNILQVNQGHSNLHQWEVCVCEFLLLIYCMPSRSLNMAPIDRSYTTYYWSAVVTIPLFCTTFKLLHYFRHHME